MTIAIHPDCKVRLVTALEEALPKLKVKNRYSVDRGSLLWLYKPDQVLPATGPVRRDLERYVDEWPLVDFAQSLIEDLLRDKFSYDLDEKEAPLPEIPEMDTSQISKIIVDSFCSLPWTYCVSVELPDEIQEMLAALTYPYAISERVKLIRADAELANSYPLVTGIKKTDSDIHWRTTNLLSTTGPTWGEGKVYLQVSTEGFIGRSSSTQPMYEVDSLLRSFFGLGIALRLFDITPKYRPSVPVRSMYVHRRVDDKWIIASAPAINDEWLSTFHDVVRDTFGEQAWSAEQKDGWTRTCFERISKVLADPKANERIIQAAQWLFDSYCGRNQLLSFVQAMVAIEILLGDKAVSDLVGVGELLRNRLAYLIGKSHKERADLMNEFNEIYSIRSKIVHRGKSRLTLAERGMSTKLKGICKRVIQEEIRLIPKPGDE